MSYPILRDRRDTFTNRDLKYKISTVSLSTVQHHSSSLITSLTRVLSLNILVLPHFVLCALPSTLPAARLHGPSTSQPLLQRLKSQSTHASFSHLDSTLVGSLPLNSHLLASRGSLSPWLRRTDLLFLTLTSLLTQEWFAVSARGKTLT